MAALNQRDLKIQLAERLEEIDTELKHLAALQEERTTLSRVLRVMEGPEAPPQTGQRVPWTKELSAYIDIQTRLAPPAEIIEGLCKKLDIVKTDTITRTIRSILSKQHADQVIGAISDFDTKRLMYGPIRFFSGPNILRPEFEHLAKEGKG